MSELYLSVGIINDHIIYQVLKLSLNHCGHDTRALIRLSGSCSVPRGSGSYSGALVCPMGPDSSFGALIRSAGP